MSTTRRNFVSLALGCGGWLVTASVLAAAPARRRFAAGPRGPVVFEEAFARIERLADGVWAVISTPFKDGGRHFTTTSNGGIVAGRDGVLVIEGYYSDEGASWVAARARELTGREATHVVVTHYHADHALGLGGLRSGAPEGARPLSMLATGTTRRLLEQKDDQVLPEAAIDESAAAQPLDLGGRVVRLVPRTGHTASDVTVELDEPRVVWCGDLVWNGMFPNYVDAIPSRLAHHCEAILGRRRTIYVPGHGDAGDARTLAPYLDLIRDVERAARTAIERGTPAAAAAAEYRVPESLGTWSLFSPQLYERAFVAWERELGGADAKAEAPLI